MREIRLARGGAVYIGKGTGNYADAEGTMFTVCDHVRAESAWLPDASPAHVAQAILAAAGGRMSCRHAEQARTGRVLVDARGFGRARKNAPDGFVYLAVTGSAMKRTAYAMLDAGEAAKVSAAILSLAAPASGADPMAGAKRRLNDNLRWFFG